MGRAGLCSAAGLRSITGTAVGACAVDVADAAELTDAAKPGADPNPNIVGLAGSGWTDSGFATGAEPTMERAVEDAVGVTCATGPPLLLLGDGLPAELR